MNYFITSTFIHSVADCMHKTLYKHNLNYPKILLYDQEKIFPGCIIYADLNKYETLEVFTTLKTPFILITSEDDSTVPYGDYDNPNNIGERILNNPALIRWYSINIGISHPKLESIPIGVMGHVPFILDEGKGAYISVHGNHDIKQVREKLGTFFPKDFKRNLVRKDKKLLYVQHTTVNSRTGFATHKFLDIRENMEKSLFEKGLMKSSKHPLIPWEQYIKEISEYKFALSLPGRGLDCHRTWECLYAGVIPIVINCESSKMYQDLPVLILDIEEFGNITEKFLEESFEKITKNVERYNWEKIEQSYWIEKVLYDKQRHSTSRYIMNEHTFGIDFVISNRNKNMLREIDQKNNIIINGDIFGTVINGFYRKNIGKKILMLGFENMDEINIFSENIGTFSDNNEVKAVVGSNCVFSEKYDCYVGLHTRNHNILLNRELFSYPLLCLVKDVRSFLDYIQDLRIVAFVLSDISLFLVHLF